MHPHPRFLADVHLGKLARKLRMLGLDTAYNPEWTKAQLLKIAVSEDRILLSRNSSLAKNPFIQTCIIISEDVQAQLAQVIDQFPLPKHFEPFSRCMVCNHLVEPVGKAAVVHLLQPQTLQHHHLFWRCTRCKKLYWEGSHYQRMMAYIRQLQQQRG